MFQLVIDNNERYNDPKKIKIKNKKTNLRRKLKLAISVKLKVPDEN